MALTDLATVKTILGVSGTTEDARLTRLIMNAEARVKAWCKRTFESTSYTEFYSGNDTDLLRLRQRPVTAVASVYEDTGGHYGQASGFGAATLLEVGTHYVIEYEGQQSANGASGLLVRVGTVWPRHRRVRYAFRLSPESGPAHGNIKVTYTAGWFQGTVPGDVVQAVAMTVGDWRNSSAFGRPLARESLGDWGYEFVDAGHAYGLPAEARALLAPYREVIL